MDDLRDQAASGGSLRKAAAGNKSSGSQNWTVFGMMECMPDLSLESCSMCLVWASGFIGTCCEYSVGFRIYTPSCIVRYELSLFYNITRFQEQPLLPSSSPPTVRSSPHTVAGN